MWPVDGPLWIYGATPRGDDLLSRLIQARILRMLAAVSGTRSKRGGGTSSGT